MKASELYLSLSAEVDTLQKALHNHVRDQLCISADVLSNQDKMKRLATIMIKEGDRQLTGIEVVSLRAPEEKAATQSDVGSPPLAKETHVA